ncbi:hypothetical protein HK104_010082, partial [Borealophlyctis nickersoniae]
MLSTTTTLALGALLLASSASAHNYVTNVNGQSGCLRPLPQFNENSPVKPGSDDLTCGAARPLSFSMPPCTFTAGTAIKAQYAGSPHQGPCAVYVSRGTGAPYKWAKIAEDTFRDGGWCGDRIKANGGSYTFTLPKQLADGPWVVRIEQAGLHNAASVGGGEFYVRCLDVVVQGGGGQMPQPVVSIPGAYDANSPGVHWNI